MAPLLLFVGIPFGIPAIFIYVRWLIRCIHEAKYEAKVEKLVPQYANASFTRECAKLIFENYQKNISSCIHKRQGQWVCYMHSDHVSLLNDRGICFETKGYASLPGIAEVKAFTKAIVQNLPTGFRYSEEFDKEDSKWIIRIQHDIPLPPLKNIANS